LPIVRTPWYVIRGMPRVAVATDTPAGGSASSSMPWPAVFIVSPWRTQVE
jgi:hypothetical protein